MHLRIKPFGYYESVHPGVSEVAALLALCALTQAQSPPAGIRPPSRKPASAILPGGRAIAPYGSQYPTGPGPYSVAISPAGKVFATVNTRPEGATVTIATRDATEVAAREYPLRTPAPEGGGAEWSAPPGGLAFYGERAVFVSEGASGQILLFDWEAGSIRTIALNKREFTGSYAGALAYDPDARLLYAADPANRRVVVIDARSRQVAASLPLAGPPAALALSPGGGTLYAALTGAPEPEGKQSLSVCALDVRDPSALAVKSCVAVPYAPAKEIAGPGLAASATQVFTGSPGSDSVYAIDAGATRLEGEIPIRIPGFESLRGVLPAGMAYDTESGRLYVAEAGINAVAEIDPKQMRVLGHIAAGWSPVSVAAGGGSVAVANAKGAGSRPRIDGDSPLNGSISVFSRPAPGELERQTRFVLEAAGLAPGSGRKALPKDIRHVVVIVSGGRTYDETLGDIEKAANGSAMGDASLARLGEYGYADGKRERFDIRGVAITPNYHAMARRWAFGDNYYSDSINWAGVLRHLAGLGVSAASPGGDADPGEFLPDQARASGVIREIDQKYARAGADLPAFTLLRLPNGKLLPARVEAGYPYEESFAADNDFALGRVIEYLSAGKWWKETAIFVIGESAPAGLDHIDGQRGVLICAGPWFRPGSVVHTNTNAQGILKTIFRLLGVPPLGLSDASAAEIGDAFASKPDFSPFRALPVDRRIFDPAEARPTEGGVR